jgi:hypothetical protein
MSRPRPLKVLAADDDRPDRYMLTCLMVACGTWIVARVVLHSSILTNSTHDLLRDVIPRIIQSGDRVLWSGMPL